MTTRDAGRVLGPTADDIALGQELLAQSHDGRDMPTCLSATKTRKLRRCIRVEGGGVVVEPRIEK